LRTSAKLPRCITANFPAAANAVISRFILVSPAAAVGVLGVVQDSRNGAHSFGGSDPHLLFGALLWLSVIAQFWSPRRMCARQVTVHARGACRAVFVLLYGLAGIRALCFLRQHGADGAAELALVDAMTTLQCYVAYGILALITVRVLAVCELHMRVGDIPRGNTPRA
jgi:hypothetical protein